MATTTAAPAADRTERVRAPWTVHGIAVLTVPLNLMTIVGASYFAFHADVTRPPHAPDPGSWQAVTLMVVLIGYAVTALVCVPGLYRRVPLARRVLAAFAAAEVLFSALKLFGLGETGAVVFLVVDVLLAIALQLPQTKRWTAEQHEPLG
jgi:hypothetical protein